MSIRKSLSIVKRRYCLSGKLDNWSTMEPGVPSKSGDISFPFYPHQKYDQWYDVRQDQHRYNATHSGNNEPDDHHLHYRNTGMPKGVVKTFDSPRYYHHGRCYVFQP
ncbi:MAG: hypothetical protein IPN60_12235 [Saprospiraceae bacterium]|nr:hypothetical protein [Candidatus Opimibacter skivensis]